MESSLLSSSRPLKPSLPIPFPSAHRRHASLRVRPPPSQRLPSSPPRAAHVVFDGIHSQGKPPGVGRGGARRRAYREAQGEPAAPPVAAAARGVARYVVPAGAVLALSFEKLEEGAARPRRVVYQLAAFARRLPSSSVSGSAPASYWSAAHCLLRHLPDHHHHPLFQIPDPSGQS